MVGYVGCGSWEMLYSIIQYLFGLQLDYFLADISHLELALISLTCLEVFRNLKLFEDVRPPGPEPKERITPSK